VYYWGYGWSKADMPNMEAWEQYLKDFIHRQKEPLNVSCEE
jgi:GTP-binding protein EngB required for normal cell division